ncbi:hypothetical protein KP509_16G026500 [Ceratopteris richardii]|uniref:Raptor N-terminal CASPase-like domain-containing protein n=1 Tax=Ceratopteris richardii TaxID=49495 RepID=A0A8T2SXG4_CERRI|nr:hypothetical protein KP509_16G026500 [Ceratopteris richardii]KAH7387517.1 hypothetical protein KP509_16G026500 [Ceratopteris richardii]
MALGDIIGANHLCGEDKMAGAQVRSQMTAITAPSSYNELIRENPGENAELIQDAGAETIAKIRATYLSSPAYLSVPWRDAYEASSSAGPAESGLVSEWRMKDRMKTSCVALVLCLNIGVDPPDIIKISPCARMECWIDPFSMSAQKALDAIGKTLQVQYERWQPRARYKLQLDPTSEDIRRLCTHCRRSAKSERVLFHYNGHGVPKPTANGEIWLFNKNYTQYIPLSVYELETWLGTPSIYVFDCSAAGMILNAFCERPDWGLGGSVASAMKDCILLAACGPHETLPQNAELPADAFTSCLTTPIKIALRWFCPRSMLRDSLDPELIDKIPGKQNDRKTPLGELNWIFTAITDTIAWNVLPRDLFKRLFRQDLLVASLFRNFLLAERIMRAANCSPQSYPRLPPTHKHPMWHAWDMAAETVLAQLPGLLKEPAEFKPSLFFTEQLRAFEVWLEHGSERKKPPEQLPIVLQVLLSQSHRFRALLLLGRFLDMGAWAVELALSVGIFPYVLKLLQTVAPELRQILVFIWTKILALDKSCQGDLVKDGCHKYFIRFLDSADIYPEHRAMAAFVLTVIVDGYRPGQIACTECELVSICLRQIQETVGQPEPLLLQWLCLCLGKLWEGFPDAQQKGLQGRAPMILIELLREPHPEVRASATFALGTLISCGSEVMSDSSSLDDDFEDEERQRAEQEIFDILLKVLYDGSPLVRAELAIGLSRLVLGHNKHLKASAAAYLKAPSNSIISPLPAVPAIRSTGSYSNAAQMVAGNSVIGSGLRVGSDSGVPMHISMSSPSLNTSATQGSPSSSLFGTESHRQVGNGSTDNGIPRPRHENSNRFYSQCVLAIYALARDPSPYVASLGRQLLRSIGVEPVVVNPGRGTGASASNVSPSSGHQRNSSVGAVAPIFSGIPRSFSWIDSPSGNLTATFRTPPASPPAAQSFLSGNGIRRVCSLEFSPLMRTTADTGLADTALVGGGASSLLESINVPPSNLYRWSCGHFTRRNIEPSQEDDEETLMRREEREKLALDGILKCQLSHVTRVGDEIASLDINPMTSVGSVLLHPFLPIVCAADQKEVVRVWDYEQGTLVNSFENHSMADKGISKLCLLNELEDSLLLVASNDGCIRVWKDYTQKNKQSLVTAWHAIQGHKPGAVKMNAVIDWQQYRGYLYASGEMSSIMVWDLNREILAFNIPSQSESTVSALASASLGHCPYFAVGYDDGTLNVFDIVTQKLACSSCLHKQKVVNVSFVPGMDSKILSASTEGALKFYDIRKFSVPYNEIDTHTSLLTVMAVHRHAPFIATGSAKRIVRVFNMQGVQLSSIRYHSSFLGHQIGPISALSFHPYKVLLATGDTESNVSIYSGDNGNI